MVINTCSFGQPLEFLGQINNENPLKQYTTYSMQYSVHLQGAYFMLGTNMLLS